jgi:predicted acetyltransferase
MTYQDTVQFVEPAEDLREAYLEFLQDFQDAGERFHQNERDKARGDFAAFVEGLRQAERGIGIGRGLVPWSTYWLVCGGRVVAACRLRHWLSDSLKIEGGHIGYAVRPGERRKGYATRMLALALERAGLRGMRRCLVTCDDDNLASTRVIEHNGGRRDDNSISPRSGKVVRRYWVDLEQAE